MPDFNDDDARSAWNHGAGGYDAFVDSGADYYRTEVHGPALLSACLPLPGALVLDLGSGQGYFTRQLARAGARATGVELSDELVAIARRREAEAPVGAEFERMSAAEIGAHWPAEHFDLVTSCMAIQDMADIPAVLASARSVLKSGGRLVFSVPHPCTDTPYREWEREGAVKVALRIDRYFETGASTCHWNMPRLAYAWDTPCWRHTLSEWSALIGDAGFTIRRLLEPRPTRAQVAREPRLDDCYRLPYFLIFDLSVGP